MFPLLALIMESGIDPMSWLRTAMQPLGIMLSVSPHHPR
jgi:hypothetical protein